MRRDWDIEWDARDQDTWDMIWYFEAHEKRKRKKKKVKGG